MRLKALSRPESSIALADTFKSTSTPSATGPASSSGSRLAEWLRVHGTIRGGKGSATATAASQNALANSNTLQNESLNSYNALMPELQTMAAHPPGTAPADLAAQSTEAMQGAGGSQGAAVGQGALLEGRTKNPGSARAAIASSSRGAGEELGRRGLQIQTNDAALKAKQQGAALGELGSTYATATGGGNAALGQVASNVNANTNAANQQWDWARTILDPAMSGASADLT